MSVINRRNGLVTVISAISLGLALTLSGCAAEGTPKPQGSSPTVTIPAPLSVDLSKYDGKAVIDIPLNRVLVINFDGKAAKKISGKVADSKIAQYVDAYSADAGKTFAPGVLPAEKGKTVVTISGGSLTKPVDVTINVVAPVTK